LQAFRTMPRDRHFALFQDHTRLKHFLLEVYLKQWAAIHISGRRNAGAPLPKMLWFVDAFAGAGRDQKGTPGSPLIAAEIATGINQAHYPAANRTTGMRVLAIEAHPGRYQKLSKALEPYPVAEVRLGTLLDIIGKVMPFLEKHRAPALFFLDPFGVHGLDARLLPQILQVPRTEILLLFSDEGAVRLAGKAEAAIPDRDELLARRREGRLSLGDDFDAETEELDRLDVERIIAGHASNPRAAEILDATFGGRDWRRIVDETLPPQRRQAFVKLYAEVLKDAGAAHVLPFAITTGEGRHKYTLIHASTHSSAFRAMKDAMDRAHRQRQPAAQGDDLFGTAGVDVPEAEDGAFSSGADIREVADQLCRVFAGRTVQWTGKSADTGLEEYALRQTPLLKGELASLKNELERRNLLKARRPLTYAFPEIGG
jgi:three-Cys-motif partner protein